jgi:hypothetical protein
VHLFRRSPPFYFPNDIPDQESDGREIRRKKRIFKTYIKEVILPNLTTIEGFQRVDEVQEEKLGVQNESNKISFQFYN